MKKLISITLFAAIGSQVFAAEDIHLRLLEKSRALLEPKEDAISLEELKDRAVGENVETRIAYERLYQAHQKINQARANYFPYGAGDVALLALTDFWNPLILAELVTSIPSKWHNVQKERHLRNAEEHRMSALRENLKNEVSHLYYDILKEEAVIALTGYETRLLEEKVRALEIQVQTGMATQADLEDAEFSALRIRDQYLKLSAYLAEERAALRMLFDERYDSETLRFQPVKELLSNETLKIDVEALVQNSLDRSHEIKAADEVIQAAYRNRSSAKWSILSFTGLGFNYMARIRFAGSKIEEAQLQKEALKQNIVNEVYTKESVLRHSIDLTSADVVMTEHSESHMLGQLASFKAGMITVIELIEADLYYLRDFRKLVVSHYNSLRNLGDLERIALGSLEQGEDSAGQLIVVENETETVAEL